MHKFGPSSTCAKISSCWESRFGRESIRFHFQNRERPIGSFRVLWFRLSRSILGLLGTAALVGWLAFDLDLPLLLLVLVCEGILRHGLQTRPDRARSRRTAHGRPGPARGAVPGWNRTRSNPALLLRLVKSLETEGHPASRDQTPRGCSICSTIEESALRAVCRAVALEPRKSPSASTPGGAAPGPGSFTGDPPSANSRQHVAVAKYAAENPSVMCSPYQRRSGPLPGRGDRPPVDSDGRVHR